MLSFLCEDCFIRKTTRAIIPAIKMITGITVNTTVKPNMLNAKELSLIY